MVKDRLLETHSKKGQPKSRKIPMTLSQSLITTELKRTFFQRKAPLVALDLLGRLFIHQSPEGPCGGIIVETEAYDESDPASHSSSAQTKRNAAMFDDGHPAIPQWPKFTPSHPFF
jgi:hypothetical protein